MVGSSAAVSVASRQSASFCRHNRGRAPNCSLQTPTVVLLSLGSDMATVGVFGGHRIGEEETSIDAPVTSLELIAQGEYDVLGTPWEGFFLFAHKAVGECVPERADPSVEWSWVTSAEMVALASLPGLLTPVAEKVDAGGMVTRVSTA